MVHFLHEAPSVENGICKRACIVLQPWKSGGPRDSSVYNFNLLQSMIPVTFLTSSYLFSRNLTYLFNPRTIGGAESSIGVTWRNPCSHEFEALTFSRKFLRLTSQSTSKITYSVHYYVCVYVYIYIYIYIKYYK